MSPYFKHPVRQTQPFSSPNTLSGLYHCMGSSSPWMDCPMPISQFRSYPSFQVQLTSYQPPHSLSYFPGRRGSFLPLKALCTHLLLHTYLCYGYYNHALNERENKSALHVVKCSTDVILIMIMVSSCLHHSARSCVRAGITSVIFVSPIELYQIKFVNKFFFNG